MTAGVEIPERLRERIATVHRTPDGLVVHWHDLLHWSGPDNGHGNGQAVTRKCARRRRMGRLIHLRPRPAGASA